MKSKFLLYLSNMLRQWWPKLEDRHFSPWFGGIKIAVGQVGGEKKMPLNLYQQNHCGVFERGSKLCCKSVKVMEV